MARSAVDMILVVAAASAIFAATSACSDRANWCASYKSYCSHDSSVRTNCQKTCGLCTTSKPKPPPTQSGCGRGSAAYPPSLRFSGDNVLGVSHGISGGYEAAPHSYPFAVQLGGPWGSATCTASIISDQWLLTAAHCVVDDNQRLHVPTQNFWVKTGSHSRNDGKTVRVKRIIAHEQFYGGCKAKGTDIAVVQLSERLQFDAETQPICLPNSGDDFTKGGKKMVAAGWGLTTQSQSGITPALQHAVFDTKASGCYRDNKKEMCAWGGYGSAACKGDSGGPLFFKRDDKWTQAGIAECGGGHVCASEDFPSVYVHVPSHRDWIKQKTGV